MKIRSLSYLRTIFLFLLIGMISCQKEKIYIIDEEPLTPSSTRIYYVQAEIVEWDYVPLGYNLISNMPFNDNENDYVKPDSNRIGNKYLKARYIEYTDATFTVQKPQESADMGIIGPVFRAEVGDSIIVYFRNKTNFPVSVHPHGVRYDSVSEGIRGVDPGSSFVYKWVADENSIPSYNDPSSLGWVYHSHVHENENMDVYAGLVGALVIYRKGFLVNGKNKNVNVEKFAIIYEIDEGASILFDQNLAKYIHVPVDTNDPDFMESNTKPSINGRMFGNNVFTGINKGDRVRWHIFTFGDLRNNFHTAHWHGNTVVFSGTRTDVILLGPANLFTADMIASNPGKWFFHCHVDTHFAEGMSSVYIVNN